MKRLKRFHVQLTLSRYCHNTKSYVIEWLIRTPLKNMHSKSSKPTSAHITVLLVALLFILSCNALTDLLPNSSNATPAQVSNIVQKLEELSNETQSKENNVILETWEILSNQFIDKENLDIGNMQESAIDAMLNTPIEGNNTSVSYSQRLKQSAITGMMKSLDDPYSTYLAPAKNSFFVGDTKGSFGGIGATVGFRNGNITILSPMPDTPAQRSGLRAGDIVLEVDGLSTKDWSLMDAVLKIRGPKGTTVSLLVRHLNEDKASHIKITRDVIEIKSLTWEFLDELFLHIRLSSFSETTDDDLVDALAEAMILNPSAIILDLRNNSGGLLSTTINIASQFIRSNSNPDNGLVFYLVDADGEKNDYYRVTNKKTTVGHYDIPLVVLTNQFSASASEVLAGAIQDHNRGVLIGSNTFGKGSANIHIGLSDGSGIYFTIARWYTPNGRIIEGSGLEPDILVEDSLESGQDLILEKAKEYLNEAIAR